MVYLLAHRVLRSTMFALMLVSLLWLALAHVPSTHAAGVVGPPCNMFTLGAAMNSGSGDISFNCGGPATIVITQPSGLNVDTGRNFTIRGGDVITLSGPGGINGNRIFNVHAGGVLTLSHILLNNGNAGSNVGGAVFVNGGTLVLDHATVQNSLANGFDGGAIYSFLGRVVLLNSSLVQGSRGYTRGAIYSYGELLVADSVVRDNVATDEGGAIYAAGNVTIRNSRIYTNTANAHGGALAFSAGAQVMITGSDISDNLAGRFAEGLGGGIYITGTSVVALNGGDVSGNVASGPAFPASFPRGGGIYIDSSSSLTASSATLSGNNSGYGGGGIENSGTLTLDSATLSGNQAVYHGGGIDNGGTLALSNATLKGNSAGDGGGGLYNIQGTATLNDSTLSGNWATVGGGVANYAEVRLTNVTLSDNRVTTDGGGITSQGTAWLSNVTLSGNRADRDGGGIANIAGTMNVYNGTIVFNQADAQNNANGTGGGVLNYNTATFNMRNTLLAGNRQGNGTNECFANIPLGSYGRNLLYVVSGCTIVNGAGGSWSLLSSLAGIGALQNNGGPTLTHMPRLGSQMIDGGDPSAGCIGPGFALLLSDQRGKTRTIDGDGNGSAICDVGAVERQANDTDLARWLWLPLVVR